MIRLQNGNSLISGSRSEGDNLQLLEYSGCNIQQDVFDCVIFAVWSVWSNKSQVAILEADPRSDLRSCKEPSHRMFFFFFFLNISFLNREILPPVVLKAVNSQWNFFFELLFVHKLENLIFCWILCAFLISEGWILNISNGFVLAVGVWGVKIKCFSNGWSGKVWISRHRKWMDGQTDHNMKGGACGSEEVKIPKHSLHYSYNLLYSWIRKRRGAEEFWG